MGIYGGVLHTVFSLKVNMMEEQGMGNYSPLKKVFEIEHGI